MRATWICAAAIAAGCGEFSAPATAPADGAAPRIIPSYHGEVAPILARHCAGCHTDDGVAPFALSSYEQAFEAADRIAATTTARIMPPWPADASGACGTFVDQRWLSDAEISTLARWVAIGAPAGDRADAPAEVPPPPIPTLEATVELGADEAYVIAPGPERYRCLVVDPGLVADHFITALAVRLDRADVVHHMQLFASTSAAADDALVARDAADPGPGYACDESGVGSGLRYVGVWATGDTVSRWPAGTGIRVLAGRRLVVQFHYHPHGSEVVADRSRVALELATTVAAEAQIGSVAGSPLVLAPGQADVNASGQRVLSISQPSWVRAARIHMHTLGTHARLELVRGDQTTCALDIPRWDVGWQLFYRFDQPIAVAPGDQIRISCHYDTRGRSEPVVWGQSTDDEMCLGYTYVSP